MRKITIFTPTYNRGDKLEKLYESIKKQKFKEFEWLIIDDGSTDNTEKIIKEFKKEKKIIIRYYKQENLGKHIAINKGAELAQGELFFIVDSDDYITEDALNFIWEKWSLIESKENFIGIGGKKILNGVDKNFNFLEEYFDSNSIDFNLKYKNIQDKAEVFHTEKLRKYKFKKFEDEKFMTEAVIWYKMAEDGYIMRWFNKEIYIGEYLEDGLSKNFYKQRIKSIKSTCYSYNELSSYNIPFKYKIRYKINYFRYGLKKYKRKKLVKELKNKEYFFISLIVGYLLKLKDGVIYD